MINENGDDYHFVYDGNERLIKEIGFDGRIQHYKYNKAGHPIKHLDAGDIVTDFERDPLGRMLSKTSRALKNPDATAEYSRYLYDPVVRPKKQCRKKALRCTGDLQMPGVAATLQSQ